MNSSYRKLFRSSKNRMIAGVCGGLADYFGFDPTWMRLIFIFCMLLGGSTLLVYLILWILVPLDKS